MGLFTGLLTLPLAPCAASPGWPSRWPTRPSASSTTRTASARELLQLELDAEDGRIDEEEQRRRRTSCSSGSRPRRRCGARREEQTDG